MMVLPNMIALLLMSGTIKRATKEYFTNKMRRRRKKTTIGSSIVVAALHLLVLANPSTASEVHVPYMPKEMDFLVHLVGRDLNIFLETRKLTRIINQIILY